MANLGKYVKEYYNPNRSHQLLPTISVDQRPSATNEFFTQIDKFIESKKKDVSEDTIEIVKSMKSHLLAYQEARNINITFSAIDYNFYCDFVDFLTNEYQLKRKLTPVYGLKTNTIGRTIKKLVWFLKDRIRRKIITPIDLVDFKVPTAEVDAVYLTYHEIGKIYHTDRC